MKLYVCAFLSIFCFTGCQQDEPLVVPQPEQTEIVAPTPQPDLSPEPQGMTKVYTYPDDLSFAVTQVFSEQEAIFVDVGGDGNEYPYTKILYYPGATLTVLSPDHQWKLSSSDPTAEPLNITQDMAPINLADVETIYHYEGLVPIFAFEAYQGTESAPAWEEPSWEVVDLAPLVEQLSGGWGSPAFDAVEQNTATAPLDQLIVFSLVADAASEGALEDLYRRFLATPHTVLSFLTLLGNQTVNLPNRGELCVAEEVCHIIAFTHHAWHEDFPLETHIQSCMERYTGSDVALDYLDKISQISEELAS